MDVLGQSPQYSLDKVMATDRLARRSVRTRNPVQENQTLVELADQSARRSGDLLGRLATAILDCCNAESAGISVLESSSGDTLGDRQSFPVFRWHATAGAFVDHAGATLPRHQSPCGLAVDWQEALLFDRPQRYFRGLELAEPPVTELLTLPFYVDGEPRGTIWAVTHGPGRQFDAEDLRLLGELAPFAAIGLRLQEDARLHEHANTILQRAYSEQRLRSARLRQFATELTSAENRARRHIAAELQENLQQVLVAARMQLASGGSDSAPAARAHELIDEAVDVSRKLVAELRPPTLYELGLLPALRWLSEQLHHEQLLDVEIECDEAEVDHVTLSEDAKGLLYEGVRELLCNVIKHSGARAATVTVRASKDTASVAVCDRGHGGAIDAARLEAQQGAGLFGIRERLAALGGGMHIESSESLGTIVELQVPIGTADDGEPEP